MKLLRSEKGVLGTESNSRKFKKYLIEETYEVLEAIDLNDKDKLCEELGIFFCK